MLKCEIPFIDLFNSVLMDLVLHSQNVLIQIVCWDS
jgi:hypothetical protein